MFKGQADEDGCPFVFLALNPDIAMMQFCNPSGGRQTQAKTAGAVFGRPGFVSIDLIQFVEFPENILDLVSRHSNTVILHIKDQSFLVVDLFVLESGPPGTNLDGPEVIGEPDGV